MLTSFFFQNINLWFGFSFKKNPTKKLVIRTNVYHRKKKKTFKNLKNESENRLLNEYICF